VIPADASFTVLGARGFIGSQLVAHLEALGATCRTPAREDRSAWEAGLGHVICCAGITADFRSRLFDTVRAHVSLPLEVLERARFDSFLYLSSTRVYGHLDRACETATLRVDPSNPDGIYDVSKLMGEALCLATDARTVRVARLSNVYGPDWASSNFLPSLVRDAVDRGRIVLRTALGSAKDYVSVDDVVRLLPQIALSGRHRVYNVASGVNTPHSVLVERLAGLTGSSVSVEAGAPIVRSPVIEVDRIRAEFPFAPAPVVDALEGLVTGYRRQRARRPARP
jgi:nucleoside-diphosphate-sugar epimerase